MKKINLPWSIRSILLISFTFSSLTFGEERSKFTPVKVERAKGLEMIQKKECDIHLSFGSYGSGTPHKVIKEIYSLLQKKRDIKKSLVWYWGKEGESDLCLILESKEITDSYFLEIKKLIPEFSKQGYTKLQTSTGKTWGTSWPK